MRIILIAAFGLAAAAAQDRVQPGTLPQGDSDRAVSATAPRTSVRPFTARDKFVYNMSTTYRPIQFAESAFGALIGQARGFPYEWSNGMEGFSKKWGSALAQNAVRAAIVSSVQAVDHEDPRDLRSQRTGIWPRTADALKNSLRTRRDDGSVGIAWSRIIGDYGAAAISRQWYPDRYKTPGNYILGGTFGLAADIGRGWVNEFAPDIKRLVLRKK